MKVKQAEKKINIIKYFDFESAYKLQALLYELVQLKSFVFDDSKQRVHRHINPLMDMYIHNAEVKIKKQLGLTQKQSLKNLIPKREISIPRQTNLFFHESVIINHEHNK